MRYLVTGGAGFIGSNIVKHLVAKGERVRVLDNFATGKIQRLKPFLGKIEIVKGDICNGRDLKKALKGIDFVLHQAALRSVPRSVDDPLSSNEVNITGTLRLLVAAREANVKRVVYASSSSVYGDSKIIPQSEKHRTAPLSPYAVSKLGGENYCIVFAKTFGLETVALRYFNVFGPNQDPESKYSAVIPKFVEASINNEAVEIHGDGLQSRDFTYIDNVVKANLLAAVTRGVSGEIFNIACGTSHSVIKIARTIEILTGNKLKLVHTPSRKGDVRKTRADISHAVKLLKYKPSVDFQAGMQKTVEYFVKEYSGK
jgi:nucleoside-diphosphate-sugar epimerase